MDVGFELVAARVLIVLRDHNPLDFSRSIINPGLCIFGFGVVIFNIFWGCLLCEAPCFRDGWSF